MEGACWHKWKKSVSAHKKKLLPDDLPDGLMPRLRLFLSVDVVGSTALKQSKQAWRPVMLGFYRDFDHLVHTSYNSHNQGRNRVISTPEFWKSIGDELVYTCDIDSLEQVHNTVQVWLTTLHAYRTGVSVRAGQLDIKSTGWIALFPTPNAEIFFRRGQARLGWDGLDDAVLMQSELRDLWYANRRTDITRDFVGPSIDTGFRLTSWAKPQRFVVSVDLAFLLTSSCEAADEPLPLHFSGRAKLKGVIDDQPYPNIWLPVGGEKGSAMDLCVGRHLADPAVLRSYCEVIIEQHYKFITPLFLSEDGYDDFDWAPPFIIREIRHIWRDELAYRSAANRDRPDIMQQGLRRA